MTRSKVLYTLPRPFLDLLLGGSSAPSFDAVQWNLELELSRSAEQHPCCVGFIDGGAVECEMLAAALLETEKDDPAQWRDARGYAGWLMTNRAFLEEHETVWKLVRPIFVSQGLMPFDVAVHFASDGPLERVHENDDVVVDAYRAYHAHCSRWRLKKLVGPYLPLPITRQSIATADTSNTMTGIRVLRIPDTLPVPSKEDLRNYVDRVPDPDHGDHLRDWKKLIASHSQTKAKTIDRYGRIFLVQHLYATLMSRHEQVLGRKLRRVQESIADFLASDLATIRRDFGSLARQHGSRWWVRHF